MMPSTRSNFSGTGGGGGGGGGKQFGGNGFSFGGLSSTGSSNTTPMNPNPNLSTSTSNSNGNHSPSPYLNHHILSPERDRGFKSSQTSHSNPLNPNGAYHHPVPPLPLPLPNRLRCGTENPIQISIPCSLQPAGGLPTTPQFNKSAQMNHNHFGGVGGQSSMNSMIHKPMMTTKWPNGVMKASKELNYQALIGVKEVKSELENTLGELSEWLESCEIGLGMLIEAMK